MPAGRPPKVEHIRDSFLKRLDSARTLVNEARSLERVKRSSTQNGLHSKHVRRVIELAFMGVAASWEEFLEQTMVRHVCGAKSSGMPKLRIKGCASTSHAYQIISGDPTYDANKRFLAWNDPEKVLQRASVFFESGGTYSTCLKKYKDALLAANKIRNRIAHSSRKASQQFIEIAKTLLGKQKLSQGYRVGDLLLEQPKHLLGMKKGAVNYMDAFLAMYEDSAKAIVP